MKVSPFAADVEPPDTGSSLVGWSLVPTIRTAPRSSSARSSTLDEGVRVPLSGLGVELYEHPYGRKIAGHAHNRRWIHWSHGVEHGPADRRGGPVDKSGHRRRFKAGARFTR
jgi:hypothetical protein